MPGTAAGNPLASTEADLLHGGMASRDTSGFRPPGAATFATTRWSVITAAGDRLSPRAAQALETLCRAYWFPLYAYVRRRGLAPADAQDVTQEYFCRLIAKGSLEGINRARGSFRSFLLASMNHLLANEWDKARTLKRGGNRQFLSLDSDEIEERFAQDATVNGSAEKAFDRRWALTLLDRALAQLRAESIEGGRLAQFEAYKRFLSDVADPGEYPALAAQLGLDAGAVAVGVHRLRLRYREIVRAEIGQTVSSETELTAEMRHLFASLD